MDRWTRRIKRKREREKRKERSDGRRSAWHHHHSHTRTDRRTLRVQLSHHSYAVSLVRKLVLSSRVRALFKSGIHTDIRASIQPPPMALIRNSAVSLPQLVPLLSLLSHAPMDRAWAAPIIRSFLLPYLTADIDFSTRSNRPW